MREQKKAVAFRQSMYGYNKDDVNQYIIDLSRRFSEKESSFNAEVDALNLRINETESKLDGALRHSEELSRIADKKISCLKAENKELIKENTDLAAFIGDLKNANKSLREGLEKIERQSADQKYTEGGSSPTSSCLSSAMSIDFFANMNSTTESSEKISDRICMAAREMTNNIKEYIRLTGDSDSSELAGAVSDMKNSITLLLDSLAENIAAKTDSCRTSLIASVDSEMKNLEKIINR